jgi:DNA-binding IclR family transcriptional regulator
MTEQIEPGTTSNRSVSRALAILELLAQTGRYSSLGEIDRDLSLPKISALTLLRALTAHGFITVDGKGRYVLGLQSFEIGCAYLRRMTPVVAAEQPLLELTRKLGVTSHFAVLAGDEVVYLAKHDPPRPALGLASALGARLPAEITAVGKVQLAYRHGSVSSWPRLLRAEIDSALRLGYATDDGRTATGIRCLAAPVFDDRGCCGAIGVSYLLHDDLTTQMAAAEVTRAAQETSLRLGHRVQCKTG